MSHTEQSLRTAAVECFRNATDLHESAEILYRAHRLEHALAIACVGIEEFGKSLVYTIGALRPDQRDRIGNKIGGHHRKRWVFTQARDTVMTLRQTVPGFTIADCFADLAKFGLDGLLITDQAAREQYVRLNDGGLIPAELKDAALYVDLFADGTLRVPRTAAKAMIYAEMHVKLLSGYLRPFAALPNVLTDNGEWDSFASEVRQSIDGAGA